MQQEKTMSGQKLKIYFCGCQRLQVDVRAPAPADEHAAANHRFNDLLEVHVYCFVDRHHLKKIPWDALHRISMRYD